MPHPLTPRLAAALALAILSTASPREATAESPETRPAITRIEALPSSLRLHLRGCEGRSLRIGELRPHEKTVPGHSPVLAWEGVAPSEAIDLERFHAGRDRLFSRFAVLQEAGSPAGAFRWVDDLAGIGSRSAALTPARSIKGIQCIVDLDDAVALGISHAGLNVSIPSLIDRSGREPEAWQEVDGARVPIRLAEVRRLDQLLLRLTGAGVRAYAILLNPVPSSPDPSSPFIHPDTDLLRAPNHLGAFNLETEAGYLHFRAAVELLAERYSRPGAPHGWLSGLIIGNELQAHWWWHNMGLAAPEAVIAEYVRASRVAYLAAAKHCSSLGVFVSMDHHWTAAMDPDPRKFIPGRRLLDDFQSQAQAGGDFPWGVAFHPYPEDLFKPSAWNDRTATLEFGTPRITFKNLEVLVAYLAQAELLHEGRRRPIILSEQGFHGPEGKAGEDLQAAAYAWTWERLRGIPEIEAFIYHRHVDHPDEGGLRLGLWTAPPAAGGRAKRIREVFSAAGTDRWEETSAFARPVAGVRSWAEVRHGAVFRARSASSAADGFPASGAVDGRRFSLDPGAVWKGEAGKGPWTLTLELPSPRKVGALLQVIGDDAELFRNAPRKYVWQGSADGSTWKDLEETRTVRERRMYRIHRLRPAADLIALRLLTLEAEGEFPAVREVEVHGEGAAIDFPEWVACVATDEKPNLEDASAFTRLARSLDGEGLLLSQRLWLDAFDPAFVSAEPRPLCAFLTGNYADWCQRTREPWRGAQEIAATAELPLWAACGGAQGLALLAEYGVDQEWDCPHCRDPARPKSPIYGHIGHTASRPCGDYSACVREDGPTRILQLEPDPVFEGLPREFLAVEIHCGQIEWPPRGWVLIAAGGEGARTRIQCLRRKDRPVYAAQFHMELDGTPETSKTLMTNFLRLARGWRQR